MDGERLFYVNDGLRIAVRSSGVSTYIIIESESKTITLDSNKWKKFKKWFPVVDTEFNLRFKSPDV